jgi:DNA-binding NarL/FixJ family response regulator
MLALERYDVVVLDIGLPDGSGWELLPLIRKLEPAPRVVVLSGQDLSPQEAAQVEAVLLKSRVSQRDLLEVIGQRIKRKPA